MKISGIILAAGASTRMGTTKQLMPFGNATLLDRVVQHAKTSILHEVVVVLGHDAVRIMRGVDLSGTRTVWNPDYLKGQSTSLKKGIEAVSPNCDAAMFLLGDQPFVNSVIIDHLVRHFVNAQSPLAIPFYNGKRGNPVIIARELFNHLRHLSGDVGAKVLFEKFSASILKVSISDPGILSDIDTRDDYRMLILKK